jgi:hypothetical protein
MVGIDSITLAGETSASGQSVLRESSAKWALKGSGDTGISGGTKVLQRETAGKEMGSDEAKASYDDKYAIHLRSSYHFITQM